MNNLKQPLILSLDTSMRRGGVAVLRGGEVLAEKAGTEKSSQSEQLLSDIREILHKNDLELKQINLIAVAVGPGSFTGLRIGLASGKALAAALKIPIVGISTLEAAANSIEKDGEIFVVLPAGRGEYFVQTFIKSSPGNLEKISGIEIFTAKNLLEKAGRLGDIIWLTAEEIIEKVLSVAEIPKQNNQILPQNLAVSVGKAAHNVFLRGILSDFPPSPAYVRGADIGGDKNAK